MNIKEMPSSDENSKKIVLSSTSSISKKAINTTTPVFMYDALGTIVAVHDPLEPLKSKEELAMYTLSSLKSFNEGNVSIFKKITKELGLEDLAVKFYNELLALNLPEKTIFFILIDKITDAYCKKIGDTDQELRISVLLKMHSLADPRIFEQVNEYSQKTFHSDISQLILTQDNPIMKQVYEQMLKQYNLDIFTVPDPKFDNLRKNNPKLYSKLSTYLDKKTNNIGFYDDTAANLLAASEVGVLTQLATGIKNDDPSIIKSETTKLINLLFDTKQFSHSEK